MATCAAADGQAAVKRLSNDQQLFAESLIGLEEHTRETVLSWERANLPWRGRETPSSPTLLGYRLSQKGVRDRLEIACRRLARQALTRSERIALVDNANARRNRSWI